MKKEVYFAETLFSIISFLFERAFPRILIGDCTFTSLYDFQEISKIYHSQEIKYGMINNYVVIGHFLELGIP